MSKAKREPGAAGGSALTGPEKAAIFMLTVGEDFAAEVFQRLDSEEIKHGRPADGAGLTRSIK